MANDNEKDTDKDPEQAKPEGPVPARVKREKEENTKEPRRARPLDEDDEEDDYEDRPRRRRPRDDDDDDRDATGGLIPYKNSKSLLSYYLGVFSLIPCIGMVLAIVAIILGIQGLKYAKKHPKSGGQAHSYVGIILGALVLIGHLAAIGLGVGAAAFK